MINAMYTVYSLFMFLFGMLAGVLYHDVIVRQSLDLVNQVLLFLSHFLK